MRRLWCWLFGHDWIVMFFPGAHVECLRCDAVGVTLDMNKTGGFVPCIEDKPIKKGATMFNEAKLIVGLLDDVGLLQKKVAILEAAQVHTDHNINTLNARFPAEEKPLVLKPCPFCGAVPVTGLLSGPEAHVLHEPDCYILGRYAPGHRGHEIGDTEGWNRRAG